MAMRSTSITLATMTPKTNHPQSKLPNRNPTGSQIQDPAPAQLLLANHLSAGPGRRTLLIHAGPEILATDLVASLADGRLDWMGRNQAALKLIQTRLQAVPSLQFQVSFDVELSQESYGSYDQVALLAPKSRALARRWLVAAWLALLPGGNLYLAGPNDLGIRSLIKDGEALFSAATILGYKKGNRVARLRKPPEAVDLPDSPDWVSAPGIAPGTWQELDFNWRGTDWHFFSLPGVFSADRLDDGTRLLLDHLPPLEQARVLDFGCGWGVIGVLAASLGAAKVDLVDIDLLAVASAKRNLAAYRISAAECLAGDGLVPVESRRYHYILTNPPFHAGKSVSYRVSDDLIAGSGSLLEPDGQLILVANRFIPYEQTLQHYFRKVMRLAENGRFQVLSASKPIKSKRS